MTLSVSSCRTSRQRLAPIASRTVISLVRAGRPRQQQAGQIAAGDDQHHRRNHHQHRCRPVDSVRFPGGIAASVTTSAARGRLVLSWDTASQVPVMVSMAVCACGMVTPGFAGPPPRRPKTPLVHQRRRRVQFRVHLIGTQMSVAVRVLRPSNPSGATPTMR